MSAGAQNQKCGGTKSEVRGHNVNKVMSAGAQSHECGGTKSRVRGHMRGLKVTGAGANACNTVLPQDKVSHKVSLLRCMSCQFVALELRPIL